MQQLEGKHVKRTDFAYNINFHYKNDRNDKKFSIDIKPQKASRLIPFPTYNLLLFKTYDVHLIRSMRDSPMHREASNADRTENIIWMVMSLGGYTQSIVGLKPC